MDETNMGPPVSVHQRNHAQELVRAPGWCRSNNQLGFEFDILPKRGTVRCINDSTGELWETAPDPLLVMQCVGQRIGTGTLEVYVNSFLSDLRVDDPLSWGQGDKVHYMIQ